MGLEDFEILGSIGKGSFASVLKVKRKSDETIYAMKQVDVREMSRKEIRDSLNEIRFLASVRHPYVVGFYECFLVKEEASICMVLEYCENGDLAQIVDLHRKKKSFFPESNIWQYLAQILEALKTLHRHKIVHRDVKTANCFLGEGSTIKLGDMNVSKRIKNELLKTQTGTPYYMAPEIWENRPYDTSSDMWALGVLLYELCALRKPFLANSFPELKRKVVSGMYPPLKKTYSRDLMQVLTMLLRVNPDERPMAWELADSSLFKRHLETPLISLQVEHGVDMLATIKLPRSMDHLSSQLPKACYPDLRPNSPDKWPAMDRARSISPKRTDHTDRRLMKKSFSDYRQRHMSENSFMESGRPSTRGRTPSQKISPLVVLPLESSSSQSHTGRRGPGSPTSKLCKSSSQLDLIDENSSEAKEQRIVKPRGVSDSQCYSQQNTSRPPLSPQRSVSDSPGDQSDYIKENKRKPRSNFKAPWRSAVHKTDSQQKVKDDLSPDDFVFKESGLAAHPISLPKDIRRSSLESPRAKSKGFRRSSLESPREGAGTKTKGSRGTSVERKKNGARGMSKGFRSAAEEENPKQRRRTKSKGFRRSSLESPRSTSKGRRSSVESIDCNTRSLDCSSAEPSPIAVKGSVAQLMEEAKKTLSTMAERNKKTIAGENSLRSSLILRRQHSDNDVLLGGLDSDKKILRRVQSGHEHDLQGSVLQGLQPAIPIYVSNVQLEEGPIATIHDPLPPSNSCRANGR